MNEKERHIYGIVCDAVAKLIPTYNVDFSVTVQLIADKLSVKLQGITELGKAFAMHCDKQLMPDIKALYTKYRDAIQAGDDVEAILRGVVYEAIEQLLPAEPRDYTLTVLFEAGKPKINMVGHTEFGIKFAQHCMANMQTKINEVTSDRKGDYERTLAAMFPGNRRAGGICRIRS